MSARSVVGPSSLARAPRPGRSGLRGLLAPGLLHALVRDADGGGARHYERAQDRPDRGWARGDLVSPDAVAPGALVVTRGVLHAFVPEPDGIAHHVRAALPRRAAGEGHTTDPNTWNRRGVIAPGSAVAAAVVAGRPVVAIEDAEGVTVWGHGEGAWVAGPAFEGACRPALAAKGARGRLGGGERLGLLVEHDGALHLHESAATTGERSAEGCASDRPGLRFRPPRAALASAGTAPAALVVDGDGWLVAVPTGEAVATYRVRAGGAQPHATLTWGAGRVDGIALLAGRNPEALTSEDGAVFQHRRHQTTGWMRTNCLRLHDDAAYTVEPDSTKLAQVSGDVDTQPVREGGPRATLSRSQSTAGVLGTDLGVRISHRNRDFLLFGDTHWHRRPWLTTRDAIAEVTPTGPRPGLPGFVFHGAPLRLRGSGATMREYDVPLDGFSLGDDFFAFFTSDHFARGQVMGRSVLARASDPTLTIDPRARLRGVTFDVLGTFSTRHFLNVSVQPVPAASVGFAGAGDVLLLFGAGSYRAGDLRLAVLDPRPDAVRHTLASVGPRWWAKAFPLLGRIDDRPLDLGVRYFAGLVDGQPTWSDREADARPLLHPGAFGEVSVRWVPEVGRFLLLGASGPEDPIGFAITLRTATTPWGPWSPRHRLLDWIARGMWFDDPYSRFIKAHGDGTDPVGDRIFRGQADATGAAYAPYFFDARRDGDDLVLRYTLSTWNPYQVVLMEHRLGVAGLRDGTPAL